MIVSELIKLLQELPADLEVMVAYDSMVCRYDIHPSRMMIVEDGAKDEGGAFVNDNDEKPGLYICAMDAHSVAWHAAQMTTARPLANLSSDDE